MVLAHIGQKGEKKHKPKEEGESKGLSDDDEFDEILGTGKPI